MNALCLMVLLGVGLASCGHASEVRLAHPRLMSETELSSISERPDWERFKSLASQRLDWRVEQWQGDGFQLNSAVRMFALLWHVEQDKRYLKTANRLARWIIKAKDSPSDHVMRIRIEALAWYADLVDESDHGRIKQKTLREKVQSIFAWFGEDYLKRERYGGGHEHANLLTLMTAALVFYEDHDDFKRYYADLINQLDSGFVPFFEYFASEDGGFHMGYEYSRYYVFTHLVWYWVLNNATGVDRHALNPWFVKTARFLGAGLRDDGTFWGIGDNHARYLKWLDRVSMTRLARLSHDPVAAHYALTYDRALSREPDVDELFFRLVWGTVDDIEFDAEQPDQWQSFMNAGLFHYQTRQDDVELSFVLKNTPVYLFNHSHRDANSFVLRLGGELAIDSGHYDRYKSDHWLHYYTRTIAHNTVVIHHPEEQFPHLFGRDMANDGGQLLSQTHFAQPHTREHLDNGMFRVGSNTLLRQDQDVIMIRMDATDNYWDQKCERFVRTVVILRQVRGWPWPVILMFDDVLTAADHLRPRWLIHSLSEPVIHPEPVITHRDGVLRMKVMLADSYQWEWIGGDGKEFWVDGQNYESLYPDDPYRTDWAGSGRLELTLNEDDRRHVFAVALFADLKEQNNPVPLVMDGDEMQIGQWTVSVREETTGLMIEVEEQKNDDVPAEER
jgi:hypothetical protein